MNDFEQRLAAALREAAAGARPPDRLMELIKRRHRRHRLRTGAVSVAALAATSLAVPLAIPALTSVRSPVTGPAPSYAAPPSPSPRTIGPAPRGMSQNCADQIDGEYARNWQRRSIHVGPLWLVDAQNMGASRDGSSPLPFGDLPINVQDGAHARITVAGPSRAYFRFLYGAADTGGRYTMNSGQLSVSLTGCRPGQDWGIYPGLTEFWGGFVVARVPACVSLDVWTKAHQPPTKITFIVGPVRADSAAKRHLPCQASPAGS